MKTWMGMMQTRVGFNQKKTLFLLGYAMIFGGVIFATLFLGKTQSCYQELPLIDPIRTQKFIGNLDISRYERNGCDFSNPFYSQTRLGIPLSKLDKVYDYDFKRLDSVERALTGVDRRLALQHIFSLVAGKVGTNTEKHIKVLKFLQKASNHSRYIQPMYPDKTMVTDPLVLLELGEMRCSHVARLAADLFESAGYKARLVQLGGHVIAEIYYDNGWHMFDADIFGNGETITDKEGNIPSIAQLSQEPFKIDRLASYFELLILIGPSQYINEIYYPSYNYFAMAAYATGGYEGKPACYIKTANNEQKLNKYYGWDHYLTVKADDIKLSEFTPFFQPTPPQFEEIRLDAQHSTLHLKWLPSKDRDNDLIGYRVHLSQISRGWDYKVFCGSENANKFRSIASGWKPDMYEKLFRQPPCEVALIRTTDCSMEIPLHKGKTFFITITPYDKHGVNVGKERYFASNEIKVIVK